MIKLVCEKCDHVWYTSNTKDNQKCCACGERLIGVEDASTSETGKCETIEFCSWDGKEKYKVS